MKIVADEGIDRHTVLRLRADGHDVEYIAELAPGTTDEVILDLAKSTDALLLTEDKDFGELVFRQGRVTSGVLLVRLIGYAGYLKADMVSVAISNHGNELRGNFAVLTRRLLRIRDAGLE